jgi:hypothetical protein
MSPINFALSSLNQTTQCVDGAVLEQFTSSLAHDATGILYVKRQDMMNVFGYQTDGIDMNNLAANDLKYYVDMTQWPANLTLNPSHAMMFNPLSTGGFDIFDTQIPNNKKLIKHDYVRYLASKLFNSTRGVDLMSNEFELNENLTGDGSLFTSMNSYNIYNTLNNICTTATTGMSGPDANSKMYLTNTTTIPTNIVRSIMGQISASDPQRFNNLDTSTDNTLIRSVPFLADDTLNFTLTIKAASGQNTLTNVALIPDRVYLISLIVTDDDVASLNCQVNDSAFIGDVPYSVFYPKTISNSSTIYTDESPPSAIPAGLGYLNNGWYYTNNTTAPKKKINWYMPPSTGATVSSLKYLYTTGQILSNVSLPFLNVYTKPYSDVTKNASSWYCSRRTYGSVGGVSTVIPGTSAHQLVVSLDSSVAYPSINGYTQIMLTILDTTENQGSFASTEEILFYCISTNSVAPNSGDVKMILNSFCVYDNGPSNIPVMYFEEI